MQHLLPFPPMGHLFGVLSTELCFKALLSGCKVLEDTLAWNREGNKQRRSGTWAYLNCLTYCVTEEKGKESSPLFPMLLLFQTASQERLFPLCCPFPFLTVLPHSLLSNSLETDVILGSSAFIPIALVLVLVAIQRADFTNKPHTPAGPRRLVPSLASGLFWVGGPKMPLRVCSFQLSVLYSQVKTIYGHKMGTIPGDTCMLFLVLNNTRVSSEDSQRPSSPHQPNLPQSPCS